MLRGKEREIVVEGKQPAENSREKRFQREQIFFSEYPVVDGKKEGEQK